MMLAVTDVGRDSRNQAITLTSPVGIPTLMLTIRSMSVIAMLRQSPVPSRIIPEWLVYNRLAVFP
jgi:hypothetical protein